MIYKNLGIKLRITSLALIFLTNIHSSRSQVLASDSLALVDLYYATNGSAWLNNTNWLVGPVPTWWGISVNTDIGRVTEIDLGSNNLSGQIPPSIGNLEKLWFFLVGYNNLSGSLTESIGNVDTLIYFNIQNNLFTGLLPLSLGKIKFGTFYISDNDFSGTVPDTLLHSHPLFWDISNCSFTGFPILSSVYPPPGGFGLDCDVRDNKLTFEDIEPNVVFNSFDYSPQDSVREALDTTLLVGSEISFHSLVGGTSNVYQWVKNGIDIPGANDSILLLNNVDFADSGNYSCRITNTLATQLTLHRRHIHLHVTEDTLAAYTANAPANICNIAWKPNDSKLQIELNLLTNMRIKSGIYNAMGQQLMRLYEGDAQKREFEFDLSGLRPGLYLCRVQAGQTQFVKKILVR